MADSGECGAGYDRAMLTLPDIRTRLSAHAPPALPPPAGERRAAVAVILRAGHTDGTPEILFIRRAERSGDPWSGHMAFPGGHHDATDSSLIATAVRETQEEIGLDLDTHGKLIGRVAHADASPPSRPNGMLVAPYVFELAATAPLDLPLALSDEVAGVVWTPLLPMVRGERHTRQARHGRAGFDRFPGYLIEGDHFVWGLTYRMLHTFFEAVHPDWTPPHPG